MTGRPRRTAKSFPDRPLARGARGQGERLVSIRTALAAVAVASLLLVPAAQAEDEAAYAAQIPVGEDVAGD